MIHTDFTGFHVIIKDSKSKETLAMSKVEAWNAGQYMIELAVPFCEDLAQKHLDVLLYRNGEAYSFQGTYRKLLGMDRCGIALYKGEMKEERHSQRFSIHLEADVIEVRNSSGILSSREHIPIEIQDISRSGIRFVTTDREYHKGDCVGVSFTLQGKQHKYYAKIMRCGAQDNKKEYGCALLTREQYENQ